MATRISLYTAESCPACKTMKTALERLGVQYTEIKLVNGMILPKDVRSIPTLAMEKDGKRTTICRGWTGSVVNLKRILISVGVLKNN